MSAFPSNAISENINGSYEKLESELFEIVVILPSSHTKLSIEEIKYTIENAIQTNQVIFTVNMNELLILRNTFTILGDSYKEYKVLLKEKVVNSNQSLNIFEFLILFIIGVLFLTFLSITLTKKIKSQ